MNAPERLFAMWFLRLARENRDDPRRMAQEMEHLPRAWTMISANAELAVEFALQLWQFCRWQGLRRDAIPWLRTALLHARHAGWARQEAILLSALGQYHQDLHDPQSALPFYRRARRLAVRAEDPVLQAYAHNNLGAALRERGWLRGARRHLQTALDLWAETGDVNGQISTIHNLGLLYRELGDLPTAIGHLELALGVSGTGVEREDEGTTLHALGMFLYQAGEPQRALERLEQALARQRRVQDRTGEANTLNSMGLVCHHLGDHPAALQAFGEALDIRRALADPQGTFDTLVSIGAVHASAGEHERASGYYRGAEAVAQEIGDIERQATALNNLGAAAMESGRAREAVDAYLRALEAWGRAGSREGQSATLEQHRPGLRAGGRASPGGPVLRCGAAGAAGDGRSLGRGDGPHQPGRAVHACPQTGLGPPVPAGRAGDPPPRAVRRGRGRDAEVSVPPRRRMAAGVKQRAERFPRAAFISHQSSRLSARSRSYEAQIGQALASVLQQRLEGANRGNRSLPQLPVSPDAPRRPRDHVEGRLRVRLLVDADRFRVRVSASLHQVRERVVLSFREPLPAPGVLATDVSDPGLLLGPPHQRAHVEARPWSAWTAGRLEQEAVLAGGDPRPGEDPEHHRAGVPGHRHPSAHVLLVDKLVFPDPAVRVEPGAPEVDIGAADVARAAHPPTEVVVQPHEAAEELLRIDEVGHAEQRPQVIMAGHRPVGTLRPEPRNVDRLLIEQVTPGLFPLSRGPVQNGVEVNQVRIDRAVLHYDRPRFARSRARRRRGKLHLRHLQVAMAPQPDEHLDLVLIELRRELDTVCFRKCSQIFLRRRSSAGCVPFFPLLHSFSYRSKRRSNVSWTGRDGLSAGAAVSAGTAGAAASDSDSSRHSCFARTRSSCPRLLWTVFPVIRSVYLTQIPSRSLRSNTRTRYPRFP